MLNPILMAALLVAGLGFFARTAARRLKLMLAAKTPADRFDRFGERVKAVLVYMFGQARMFRYRAAGVAHAFIFIGFMVLGLRTIILATRGFTGPLGGFGFWIFDDHAPLGVAYLFLKDLIGGFVVAGVLYFLYTRLVTKPRRMTLSGEGVFILCMILGLISADMVYEAGGYVLAATDGAGVFHAKTPLASMLALVLQAAPDAVVKPLTLIGFWAHTIIVLTFLNFLPFGKHFHVITVLPNVLFSNLNGIGRLRPVPDIEGRLEREETLGVRTAADFSWKDVLDFYTCTECGRCSDNCPATNTGKLLSPKQLTIDLRDHMLANEERLVSAGGDAAAKPDDNDDSSAGGLTPLKEDERFQLIGKVVDPEVIWACTTCGACEQECPVFITYVDKIVDLRRHMVMEQGEFPEQLQNAFRGLETVGNPYSFANEQRADWAAGLNVPLRSEKPDAEYLFWVGCAPSFDDRSRKIAVAMAKLLQKAGVDFAILGPEETCNGDPARRSGNEYVFQMFAQQNVETLKNYDVRKIITTCPHCFNTLANEYPEFGGNFEVIHHTTFLHELIRAGKLKPANRVETRVAYHDSCYIGRYNGIYDPPREILKAIPGVELVEAPESRDRGMCCGAGGAQMWKEDEPVRDATAPAGAGKVNHARTRQLLRVLPSNGKPRAIASACPFCKTMLSDGLADQGHADITQSDVVELLLRSVEGEPTPVVTGGPA